MQKNNTGGIWNTVIRITVLALEMSTHTQCFLANSSQTSETLQAPELEEPVLGNTTIQTIPAVRGETTRN